MNVVPENFFSPVASSPDYMIPISEVSKQAGIGTTEIYRLIKAGLFPDSYPWGEPSKGLGRCARVRWSQREVQEHIEARKVQARLRRAS